jgi:hypothetical protein
MVTSKGFWAMAKTVPAPLEKASEALSIVLL